MNFEPLGIGHDGLLRERLRGVGAPISEYSFPNLYLFRKEHGYEVLTIEGEVFVRGVAYDGANFVMPTRDPRLIDRAVLNEALSLADCLFPIAEEWLPAFDEREFRPEFREGDTDYLYTVEKLGSFPGRKLHSKRNLLKQFMEGYRHEAVPLTPPRLGDAVRVLDAWAGESPEAGEATDVGPCREALDRYHELILCGGIYYAEGEPAGFVLGEELNDETFVLHFAKGLTRFKGIYQYMFSTFANILPPKYRLINLEQDLENPALRHAKASYQPDIMLKKLRVFPK